jgi:transcriptional regulator with XRE-family HTH domain
MPAKAQRLFPSSQARLAALGERLRLARLRRRFSAATVAARAGISRVTLYRAEHGNPAVSLGTLLRILEVLMLERDLDQLAHDDELGRKLQDLELPIRRRAPKKPPATS